MTSIIIVNHNGREITAQCLRSLQLCLSGSAVEVILVDNASTDGSVEWLRHEFCDLRVISLSANFGFGYANNVGAQQASGEYLLFLNNDTEVTMDILTPMLNFMELNQNVGIVGPKLLSTDGSFQLSYGEFPSLINEFLVAHRQQQKAAGECWECKHKKVLCFDWVTGAAMMIRRPVFDKIGGFDNRFFMYFEDADLCLRVRNAGYHVCWLSEISLVHHRGKSSSSAATWILEEYRKSQLYYYEKHRSKSEKSLLKLYLVLKFLPDYVKRETRAFGARMLKIVLDF